MKRSVCLFLFLTINTILFAQAQTWRSELYPENWKAPGDANFYSDKLIQDFSYAGYHRGEKEIPFRTQQVLDVTRPPYNADHTGMKDVTAILQKAIHDVGQLKQGGIVYLPKGTYKISPDTAKDYCLLIDHSHVVLRGAGPGETFLYNSSIIMRGKAIIKIGTGNSWASEGQNKELLKGFDETGENNSSAKCIWL